MRAIWQGTVSFVLVNIPVRLYSAIEEEAVSFDLLHKKDNSRIRYARVCKEEEVEVPYDEVVKGYEYHKDKYVIVEEKDFQKADLGKTHSVDIIGFCEISEIDPLLFSKPYFLEPTEGAEKAFALFREALVKSKKIAIAKFTLREREHLAAIIVREKAIVLLQMRYAYDLRNTNDLKLPGAVENQEELSLALALIEKLTKPFEISKYKDEYREKLLSLINAKAKGELVEARGTIPEPTEFRDLMDKLKESLEKEKAGIT